MKSVSGGLTVEAFRHPLVGLGTGFPLHDAPGLGLVALPELDLRSCG